MFVTAKAEPTVRLSLISLAIGNTRTCGALNKPKKKQRVKTLLFVKSGAYIKVELTSKVKPAPIRITSFLFLI